MKNDIRTKLEKLNKINSNSHDPTDNKVYDSSGKVVRNTTQIRKGLVEDFLELLQSSLNDKLGMSYINQIDIFENYLFEMETYVNSLKDAAQTITSNYPSNENDQPLNDLCDLSDVLIEGIGRVKDYIEAIKLFDNDLKVIKSEMYTHIQTLFQEI